ncbi:unnamed protein product, partial [Prorocentrum cordatum]
AVHAAAGLARGTGAVRLLRTAEGICRAAVAKLEGRAHQHQMLAPQRRRRLAARVAAAARGGPGGQVLPAAGPPRDLPRRLHVQRLELAELPRRAAAALGLAVRPWALSLELVRVPSAAEPTAKNEDEEMAELNDEWADTAPVRLAQPPPAGPACRRDAILAALAVSPIFACDPALAATWVCRTAEELERLTPWLQDELAALGHAPCAPGLLGAV